MAKRFEIFLIFDCLMTDLLSAAPGEHVYQILKRKTDHHAFAWEPCSNQPMPMFIVFCPNFVTVFKNAIRPLRFSILAPNDYESVG